MYREMDMPGGWFLVNDGYGCGYGHSPFLFPNGTKTFPHDFEDLDCKRYRDSCYFVLHFPAVLSVS